MKILLVGAGAVGQVYGYHLQRGGAEITFFVKEKYRDALAQDGMPLYPLQGKHKGKRVDFRAFTLVSTAHEVVQRGPYDQVWLCMSSTALKGPWLEPLLEAIGPATVVSLQPGLEDAAYLAARIGAGEVPEPTWGGGTSPAPGALPERSPEGRSGGEDTARIGAGEVPEPTWGGGTSPAPGALPERSPEGRSGGEDTARIGAGEVPEPTWGGGTSPAPGALPERSPEGRSGGEDTLHMPARRLVRGLIPMISYQAPLPGETCEPPGVAFYKPPGKNPFSGPTDRLQPVLAALNAGGWSSKAISDVARTTAVGSAIMVPVMAGLELSGWKFRTFGRGDGVRLASAAVRQTTQIAAPGFRRPMMWFMARGWTLRWILFMGGKVLPLNLEVYLGYHFTKVADQTRAQLQAFIAQGKAKGQPVDAIEGLLARLPVLA